MDIAAIMSVPDLGSVAPQDSQESSLGDLGGFINNLVAAVRSVKEQGGGSDNSVVAGGIEDDGVAEDIDAALAAVEYLQSLGIDDRQALERITLLVVEGGLDSEILAGLDQQELAGLAEWALEGAGGLFEPALLEGEAGLEQASDTGKVVADFGMSGAVEALELLEQIQQKIAGAGEDADGLPNVLQQLIGLDEQAGVAEIDGIATNLLEGLKQLAAEAGLDVEEFNLREVLQALPAEKIEEVITDALASEGIDAELPKLPDSILRSLALEIISIDNNDADVGDQRVNLLDALDNNQALREELLRQVGEAGVQELEQSVDRDTLESAVENLLGDELVDEEVELDTAEEIDDAAELGVELAGQDQAEVEVNAQAQNEETVEIATDMQARGESAAQSGEQVVEAVKVETADSTPEAGEAKADETLRAVDGGVVADDSEFDGEDDTQQKREGSNSAQGAAKDQSQQLNADKKNEDALSGEFAESLKDSLTDKEYAASDTAQENIAAINDDAPAESEPMPARSETQTARYANMTENIERIEKLLNVSSGNNLKNITLELTPVELGKITINVEYKDGQVHTVIKTENEQARDLLLSGSEQLKKNLEASGVKIETFEVNVERDGYGDGSERNRESWSAAQQERDKRRRNSAAPEGVAVAGEGEIEPEEEFLGIVDGSVNLLA